MKFSNHKINKILFSIFLALFFFTWGVICVQYQVFPFNELVFLRHLGNEEKKPSGDLYRNSKISIFFNTEIQVKNVMIGDSITERAEWNELFPNVSISNRGIAGDTTEGVLNRLDSILIIKPINAFIMLGINDILNENSPENTFKKYVQLIINLQKNDINPVIQSTLFISKERKNSENINKFVERLNALLFEYATQNNLVFINLNETLSENNGLKNDVTDDGVHLTGEGYKLWKYALQKYQACLNGNICKPLNLINSH